MIQSGVASGDITPEPGLCFRDIGTPTHRIPYYIPWKCGLLYLPKKTRK